MNARKECFVNWTIFNFSSLKILCEGYNRSQKEHNARICGITATLFYSSCSFILIICIYSYVGILVSYKYVSMQEINAKIFIYI